MRKCGHHYFSCSFAPLAHVYQYVAVGSQIEKQGFFLSFRCFLAGSTFTHVRNCRLIDRGAPARRTPRPVCLGRTRRRSEGDHFACPCRPDRERLGGELQDAKGAHNGRAAHGAGITWHEERPFPTEPYRVDVERLRGVA